MAVVSRKKNKDFKVGEEDGRKDDSRLWFFSGGSQELNLETAGEFTCLSVSHHTSCQRPSDHRAAVARHGGHSGDGSRARPSPKGSPTEPKAAVIEFGFSATCSQSGK